MPILPTQGGDSGVWGTELNTWLTSGHNADGSHPPLSQYAPAGLTGAQAATSYAGGTASGHPLSGTWAQGQWVMTQDGRIWACVAGGTPGTWRRVDRDPSQFTPEDYGAKRDGKYLYDVSMTSGSAVLTTAGLPAPSAPSVANSGTGGTVAAGVYQIVVTYVNQYGETLGSTASSTTAVGTTSKITVTSPAPWTNATGYYVYCTQAGGATFTRQQTAGSPTALRTSYVITAPPANTGAAPPAANTSNSAPFSAADAGKAIVVPSAGGFTNVPLSTTIASYDNTSNGTRVTLAAAASSTVTGYGALYGSDDTSPIQQAINAAVAYAQDMGGEQADVDLLLTAGIYMTAGALTGTYQNAQITIPYVNPYVGPKVNLRILGPSEAWGPLHWEQPNPPSSGAVIASTYYSDSGAPPSPTPAVICGPVSGAGLTFGGNGGLFSNMRVTVDGLNLLVPYRTSITGLNLYGAGQADIKSFAYAALARTLGASAGGWPPYVSVNNPSPWTNSGYITPGLGNNAQNDLDRITVYGPWFGVTYSDHFNADTIKTVFTNFGTNATGGGHHCTIKSLMCEASFAPIFADGSGSLALTVQALHTEDATYLIDDPSNLLLGEVHGEGLNLGGGTGTPAAVPAGKNGGRNIKLWLDNQALGATFSVTPAGSGTALRNNYWQNATVKMTGGTVTDVTVDGISYGVPTTPFPWPSGSSLTITYSVAPTLTAVLS